VIVRIVTACLVSMQVLSSGISAQVVRESPPVTDITDL
jgi:hypothetical protein